MSYVTHKNKKDNTSVQKCGYLTSEPSPVVCIFLPNAIMYYCFLGSKYQRAFLKVTSANMIVFYITPSHGCYYTLFVISISCKLHYLFLLPV